MNEVLGNLMIAAPFIILFIYGVRETGWGTTCTIFGSVALLLVWIKVAAELLHG